MSAGSAIPYIVLVGAGLLTIAGVVLLIMALLPRREGKTPYCQRCGYDLSGAVSGACSECGASLTAAQAVVFGKRRRRRGRLVVAACILVVGLVPLGLTIFGMVHEINWYHYYPTSLVLRNVQSANLQTASLAYLELKRRRTAGTFPASRLDELAAICLAEQTRATPRGSISQLLVNELGTMYTDGNLTPAQVQQILENSIQGLALQTRQPAVIGQCLPLAVEFNRRMPGTLHATVMARAVRIDGQKVSDAGMGTGSGGWHDSERLSMCESMPDDTAAGKHTLEVDVRVEIIQLVPGNVDWDDFLYEQKHTVGTSIELLAEEPEDYVRLVRDAELDQTVVAAIALTFPSIVEMRGDGTKDAQVCVTFTEHMPIAAAFELRLESDGKILGTKEVGCPKDNPYTLGSCTYFPVEDKLPPVVDIRLVPNQAVATKTVDMFEIWGGELLFEDVEVPLGGSTTMPWASYRPVLVTEPPGDSE